MLTRSAVIPRTEYPSVRRKMPLESSADVITDHLVVVMQIEPTADRSVTFQLDDRCAILAPAACSVVTYVGALGTPSRTEPLARKYLPGFPYS